jgi:hypothetical protein
VLSRYTFVDVPGAKHLGDLVVGVPLRHTTAMANNAALVRAVDILAVD